MSELEAWAADHARRVQKEQEAKFRLGMLQRMQDRTRKELMADIDADIIRGLKRELESRRLGKRARRAKAT